MTDQNNRDDSMTIDEDGGDSIANDPDTDTGEL
jgi:hypothetical protein